MKVMVIGPSTPGFDSGYNKSIARAFETAGFSVRLMEFAVSTPSGLMNRLRVDLPLALGNPSGYAAYRKRFNSEVAAEYREFLPNLVLCIRGSKLDADTLATMRGSIRILWCQDAVGRCELSREQLQSYERIYVFEESDINILRGTQGLEAAFLPLAFDPHIYHPIANSRKDIDIFFVGAYYDRRREILEGLATDFPQLNIKFYGRYVRYRKPATYRQFLGYALKGQLGVFHNRSMNPSEINTMYNRSRISINIHHQQSDLGCNPRVFEIMGAGGFQLTDGLDYIKREFQNLAVTYADYSGLRTSIENYIDAKESRERIAMEGMAYVLSRHTFLHRIHSVISDCGVAYDARAALARQSAAVAALRLGNH